MIEIWERVQFRGRTAISWERSLDAGRTWEQVPWPGEQLPFVRCVPYMAMDAAAKITVIQREEISEQS